MKNNSNRRLQFYWSNRTKPAVFHGCQVDSQTQIIGNISSFFHFDTHIERYRIPDHVDSQIRDLKIQREGAKTENFGVKCMVLGN